MLWVSECEWSFVCGPVIYTGFNPTSCTMTFGDGHQLPTTQKIETVLTKQKDGHYDSVMLKMGKLKIDLTLPAYQTIHHQ